MSNPYVVNNSASLEGFNEDPTLHSNQDDLTTMGMGLDDLSWWPQDVNPQLSFNSPDLGFDSTAFGSSTLTNCGGFNQDFSPTFNSATVSSDNTPSAFCFEQFSRPSSTFTSDFSSNVPNNNLSFSVPSMFAPASNVSPLPSQPPNTSSFLQFQSTQAPATVYPHTGALPANTSPSDASPQPTTMPLSAALSANTSPSNASPQLTTMPLSAALPANTSPSNASPQPTTVPLSDLLHSQLAGNPETSTFSLILPQPTTTPSPAPAFPHTGALPVNALPSNASPQPTTMLLSPLSDLPLAGNPETSALSTSDTLVSGTSLPVSTDSRRSGRNPVPSKRHEQMNKIDGKGNNKTTAGSAHIEKENISPSTIPEWTIASHDYLLKSDLGKEWTACVQAWFELEQDLGYGSQAGAKVCLLIFFSSSRTSDLNSCHRELYRSQQLVHRSGRLGHQSPAVVSATSSLPLQLRMPESLGLRFRLGGIASSPHFASPILGSFLLPSTPVQQVTRTPGPRCERAAPTVWFQFSPYSFGGARDWRSNLTGKSTAHQIGSNWLWMLRSA